MTQCDVPPTLAICDQTLFPAPFDLPPQPVSSPLSGPIGPYLSLSRSPIVLPPLRFFACPLPPSRLSTDELTLSPVLGDAPGVLGDSIGTYDPTSYPPAPLAGAYRIGAGGSGANAPRWSGDGPCGAPKPFERGAGSSQPESRIAAISSWPSVSPPDEGVWASAGSASGGGGKAGLYSLYPPISAPHTSSSDEKTLPASLSYSLLVHGPRPPTGANIPLSSPWNPAPNCRSKSLRRFSSRRSLRNRDRSQSSHLRSGMVVPSKTAVLSSCPALLTISPSTRLQSALISHRARWTHLVSPQEKSSKCQNEYTGRTKFQIGSASMYTTIHAT